MCCTGINSHAVEFYHCWTAGRKRVMTFPTSSPVWILDEASESVLPGWDQCLFPFILVVWWLERDPAHKNLCHTFSTGTGGWSRSSDVLKSRCKGSDISSPGSQLVVKKGPHFNNFSYLHESLLNTKLKNILSSPSDNIKKLHLPTLNICLLTAFSPTSPMPRSPASVLLQCCVVYKCMCVCQAED